MPPDAVTLRSTPDSEAVFTYGLSRTDEATFKIAAYLEGPRPDVLLVGNHQIQFMSARSLSADLRSNYFFNMSFGDEALPAARDLVAMLKRENKLPKSTLLVHITTPANDNGDAILTYGGQLHPRIVFASGGKSGREYAQFASMYYTESVKQALSFGSAYANLISVRTAGKLDPQRCFERIRNNALSHENGWLGALPFSVRV